MTKAAAISLSDYTAVGTDLPTEAQLLSDILSDPDALRAPEAVVPRLAWRERVTLFAAREKLGKSTMMRAAIAALSQGRPFLGEPTRPDMALFLALEGPRADHVRDLQAFGVWPELVAVRWRVTDPLADLEREIAAWEPALVVVDTLPTFVESLNIKSGDTPAWIAAVNPLARLAQDSGAAIILVHHGSKIDGSYRDSTAIGAAVDMILEIDRDPREPSVRRIKPRGRFHLDPYGVRLVASDEGRYLELADRELSLDARILLFIERNRGCSTRNVRESVQPAKATDVQAALAGLEGRGVIENRGDGRGHRWFATGSRENPQ